MIEWRDIIDYEGLYQVSNTGMVKSLKRIWKSGRNHIREKDEHILIPRTGKCGYPYVILCKNGKVKTHKIHRLVAINFINNPDNLPVVRHKNDIVTDNNVSNLIWGTIKDNNDDRQIRNRQAKGEKISKKLNNSDILDIRNSNLSTTELSKLYNVHKSTIHNIIKCKTWKHL
jgi:hypothetical protein